MRKLKALIVIAFFAGSMLPLATATPQFAKKTGKACTFCHVKPGSKELTDAGKYYKKHHTLDGYKAPEKK